jgi:hypothetical protein
MHSILKALIQRSCYVAIESGVLIVRNKQGSLCDKQKKWIDNKSKQLIKEILTTTNQNGFAYRFYNAQHSRSKKIPSVILQFSNIVSEEQAYAAFNVDLNRTRDSKNGKKGSPLPPKQFSPPAGGAFVEFWKDTGLKPPKRRGSYHDYMGKLKCLLFQGEIKGNPEQAKLINKTLTPLEVSFNEIKRAMNTPTITEKNHTNIIHFPNQSKVIIHPLATSALKGFPTTCNSPSSITDVINRNEPHGCKAAENQSIDEWLIDYG